MKIIQHYEQCLSQASYYISNNGIAAVIDPLRDVESYLRLASEDGAEIRYIFETHFHADFVSGHLELAERTKAQIVFGPDAKTTFSSYIAKDGETFDLNGITLSVLHTPGHTLESSCYLLKDESGLENCLFTGDTLFIGDVGRPDLAQDNHLGMTMEDLAGKLFDSLRSKIMILPDSLKIYPGHGAGSACGKNISKERHGDLGSQRISNYALDRHISREEFIAKLCCDIAPPPPYFAMNVGLNINGYARLDGVIEKSMIALDAHAFNHLRGDKTIVIDTRNANAFSDSHVPDSIFIGLDGSFAPWVGELILTNTERILLVCDEGKEREAITRLARIGYHQCEGFLKGGISAWVQNGYPIETVSSIEADHIYEHPFFQTKQIIDVRTPGEFHQGNVYGSKNLPLNVKAASNKEFGALPNLVYCAGGYRSMVFISLLKRSGNHGLINILGGYGAITKAAEKKI